MNTKNNSCNDLQADFADLPPLLDTQQASMVLGISRQSVCALVKNGTIKGRLVGKYYRIPRKYLLAYLSEGGEA